MTSVDVLERFTLVTPLGVRFLDSATGAYVAGPLSVEVYPKGEPDRRTRAVVNRASVFVFRDLPNLGQIERGEGDAAFWASQAPRYPFVLDVRDGDDRFLPFTLDVLLPARRLLGIAFGSPVASPLASQTSSSNESLPVFSSPARAIPDAMGALRAEIVDSGTGGPAAWALVEAKGPGQAIATGLADGAGRVLLPLPYPKPVVTLGSPGSPSLPVTAQSWPVEFTVRYSRSLSIPAVPNLAAVLAQPTATVWADVARTTPLTQGTLRFGRVLVLASVTGSGTPSPTLLITPAGSPL
jgi:hypothetical protein